MLTETIVAPATPSPAQMGAAGLRAFFRIAAAWRLSTEEQMVLLGEPGRSTFFKWKKEPETARVQKDTLERLSYILGIYKALEILLPVPEVAEGWVRRPNSAPLFGGKSALERMLAGQVGDLMVVRKYLDAQRGGWA